MPLFKKVCNAIDFTEKKSLGFIIGKKLRNAWLGGIFTTHQKSELPNLIQGNTHFKCQFYLTMLPMSSLDRTSWIPCCGTNRHHKKLNNNPAEINLRDWNWLLKEVRHGSTVGLWRKCFPELCIPYQNQ